MEELINVFFREDLFFLLKKDNKIELYGYCDRDRRTTINPEDYIRFYNEEASYCVAEIHRDRVYKYETFTNKQLALAVFVCFGYNFFRYILYDKTIRYTEKDLLINRFNELYERINQYIDVSEHKELLMKYFINPKDNCPHNVIIDN